jgi:hypothetical protein
MLRNYKCDISKTRATASASVTKFNSNYVSKRTAFSSDWYNERQTAR